MSVKAQSIDSIRVLLHEQLLASGDRYSLERADSVASNTSLAIRFIVGTIETVEPINISSIESLLPTYSKAKNNYSIWFVNRNLGFFYGFIMAEKFFPFLYRTEDGGKSWNLVLGSEKGGFQFERHEFMMFNERQGIAFYTDNSTKNLLKRVVLKHNKRLRYYLTDDGGITWKYKKKRLKRVRLYKTIKNESCIQPTGTIEFKCITRKEGKPDLVLRSTNFGKSFKYENANNTSPCNFENY